MLKLLIPAILASAFSPSASACREAYRTDEARLAAADVAFVARVSGVQSPALEREGYSDPSNWIDAVYSPRTIRLVLTRRIKGKPSRVVELEISQCNGSLDADVGASVTAYNIHGQWWLRKSPGEK